jgi:CRISPR-associated protein Csb3
MKTWAGRMDVHRIGRAMQSAISQCAHDRPFDAAQVVVGPDGKKVEPFYFDARRGATAHPLDLGFSPDALELSAIAHPASEFLALVGLQRFRPFAADKRSRVLSYRAWQRALPIAVAAVAAANAITQPGPLLRFENLFRTDQRKHKAFSPAVTLQGATP